MEAPKQVGWGLRVAHYTTFVARAACEMAKAPLLNAFDALEGFTV
jgi:hypothetical protein